MFGSTVTRPAVRRPPTQSGTEVCAHATGRLTPAIHAFDASRPRDPRLSWQTGHRTTTLSGTARRSRLRLSLYRTCPRPVRRPPSLIRTRIRNAIAWGLNLCGASRWCPPDTPQRGLLRFTQGRCIRLRSFDASREGLPPEHAQKNGGPKTPVSSYCAVAGG
jgi:hypothetical protein